MGKYEYDKDGIKERYFKAVDSIIGTGADKLFRSKRQFADAIGLTGQQINNVEKNDRYNVSVAMLSGLQAVAGDKIDVGEILTGQQREFTGIPNNSVLVEKDKLDKLLSINSLIHIEVKEWMK